MGESWGPTQTKGHTNEMTHGTDNQIHGNGYGENALTT